MKKVFETSMFVVACVLLIGTTGCQTGWKISNPFSRQPKASHADAPRELEELDELNDITPPPENYTMNDSAKKSDETSLAQRGKYDAGEDKDANETKLAKNDAPAANEASPKEDFRTPDYAQSYQTSNALAEGVGSARRNDAEPAPATDSNLIANQTTPNAQTMSPSQIYATPEPNAVAQNQLAQNAPIENQFAQNQFAQSSQLPNAPDRNVQANSFAPNVAPEAPYPNFDDLAFTPPQGTPYNPIAQVSGAAVAPNATQAPNANAAANPTSLAFNYDAPVNPNPAPVAPNNGYNADADPYSNVFYEPQTFSGGFAPGSVIY